VNEDHSIIAKMFKEEVNSPLKWEVERHSISTRSNPCSNAIINYFVAKYPSSKRIIWNINYFLKIWACWLLKIICPCNLWRICGWSVYVCICVQYLFFLKKIVFMKDISWVGGKNKQLYVLPILAKHNYTIMSFDLWLSKGAHDILALVINILGICL
jgi:hypothetical protein